MGSPSDLRDKAEACADAINFTMPNRAEVCDAIHAALVSAQKAERDRCVGIARERAHEHRESAAYFETEAEHDAQAASAMRELAEEAETIATRIAAALEGKEPK